MNFFLNIMKEKGHSCLGKGFYMPAYSFILCASSLASAEIKWASTKAHILLLLSSSLFYSLKKVWLNFLDKS